MAIEFEYAQARVQARCGERLTPGAWQLLESGRDLSKYLHAARGTALAPRVQSFSATSSPHAIERSLRRDWRGEVELAARWVPPGWRAAVAWTSWLADLPALARLVRGGEVPPWVQNDAVLAPFALDDPGLRRREMAAAGLAALFDADGAVAGWRRHFEASWPARDAATARLEAYADFVERYRDRLAANEIDAATHAASLERLETRSLKLIRRSLSEPVTICCYLLLVALDLKRLRDGLLRRALFNAAAAA